MSQMIDACGLSCPEPIIKLKQVIKTATEIELLVDNKTSVDACSRFARMKGFQVNVTEDQKIFTLHLMKI